MSGYVICTCDVDGNCRDCIIEHKRKVAEEDCNYWVNKNIKSYSKTPEEHENYRKQEVSKYYYRFRKLGKSALEAFKSAELEYLAFL